MSNILTSLAIFTAITSALVAAFTFDPCGSPCGNTASVDTTAVWSGGSDTGGCIPEKGLRLPKGWECSETECSFTAVAYKEDDTCKTIDERPCKPEKPFITRDNDISLAVLDDDDVQDRSSGCIKGHRPYPPPFTLTCYDDNRRNPDPIMDEDGKYKKGCIYVPPTVIDACYRDNRERDHDDPFPIEDRGFYGRCYDISGDLVTPDYFGPCFDRWGNLTDVQTPFNRHGCI